MSLSRFVFLAVLGSLFYILLASLGLVHAECHPMERAVFRLNSDTPGTSCRVYKDGALEKLADQATWVLVRYRTGQARWANECPDLTEYVINTWEYGQTCTDDERWERLQEIRHDLQRSIR